jgi:hypothetical protein
MLLLPHGWEATGAPVADALPGLRLGYQPVVIMHRPEATLDVVADVLWLRPALVPRLADLAGQVAPVPSR